MPYFNKKIEENFPGEKGSESLKCPDSKETPASSENSSSDHQDERKGRKPSSAEIKKKGLYSILGDFEIHHKLGQGAMGTVYLGRQISLDRPVAIKLLPKGIADDESFVKRFELEAKSIARISSSHVVQIYAAGNHEGQEYFAMEYVEGKDLGEKLRNGIRLSHNESLGIIKQVALGLAAAAEHAIIHRDIKPSNIMITTSGIAKIMDFGLVKLKGREDAEITMVGTLLGTANYQSPEQGRGEECDMRSDIYSLGVVFYQLLTGRLPFRGDSPTSIIYQHNCVEPKKPKTIEPTIPEDLQAIVLKCMEKEAVNRYQHPMEIVAAIEKLGDKNYDDLFLEQEKVDATITSKSHIKTAPEKSSSEQMIGNTAGTKFPKSFPKKQEKKSKLSTLIIGSSIMLLIAAMYFPLYLNRQNSLSVGEARELLEHGIFSFCRDVTEAKLRSHPNDSEWLELKKELDFMEAKSILRIAELQTERKSFDAAKINLQRVLQLNPRNSHAEVLMARLKKRDEEFGKASKFLKEDNFLNCRMIIKEKLKHNPHDLEWRKLEKELNNKEGNKLLQLIAVDFEQNEFNSAESKLEKAAQLIPEHFQVQEFKKVIEDRNNNLILADQLLAAKDFSKLRKLLDSILDVFPEDPKWLEFQSELNAIEGQTLFVSSKSAFAEGNYAQAKAEIRTSLKLIPDNEDAKNLFALLNKRDQFLDQVEKLLEQENFRESRKIVEEQIRESPTDMAWKHLQTELNKREGLRLLERAKKEFNFLNYELSREASRKTLELLPENPEAHRIIELLDQRENDLMQVRSFFSENELSKSRVLIDTHLNTSPKDPDWIKMRKELIQREGINTLKRAQDEFGKKNYALARKLAFQVIQSIPDNAEAQEFIDTIDRRDKALSEARQHLLNGEYSESRDIQKRFLLQFPGDQDWLNFEKEIDKAEGNSLLLKAIADYERENYLAAETALVQVTALLPDNEYAKTLLEQVRQERASAKFDIEPLRLTSGSQAVKTRDQLKALSPKEENDSKKVRVVLGKDESTEIRQKNEVNPPAESSRASKNMGLPKENLAEFNGAMKKRANEINTFILDESCTIRDLDEAMKSFIDSFGKDNEEFYILSKNLEDRKQQELFRKILQEIDHSVVAREKDRLTYFISPEEHIETLHAFIDQPDLLFKHRIKSFERIENKADADVTIHFSFHNMPETEIHYHYEVERKGEEWVITSAEMLESLE